MMLNGSQMLNTGWSNPSRYKGTFQFPIMNQKDNTQTLCNLLNPLANMHSSDGH